MRERAGINVCESCMNVCVSECEEVYVRKGEV